MGGGSASQAFLSPDGFWAYPGSYDRGNLRSGSCVQGLETKASRCIEVRINGSQEVSRVGIQLRERNYTQCTKNRL